jgi:hypothetical protein
MTAPLRTRATPRYVLFIESGLWPTIVLSAAIAAVALFPAYYDESLWIGAAIFTTILVGRHTLAANRRVPWIPGFIALIAMVQGVFATWAAYHMPPTIIPMAVSEDRYFAFAVPAVLALVVGMYLPLIGPGRAPAARAASGPGRLTSTRLVSACDLMVLFGLFVRVVVLPLAGGSLSYAVLLLASLSYVGAFGLLILGAPRWKSRIAVVLGVEAAFCALDGIFYALIIWAAHTVALATYARKTPSRRVIVAAVAGVLFLMIVNGFKRDYRLELGGKNLGAAERAMLAGQRFVETATDPAKIFSSSNVAYNAARLNQGNITSRILYWVPSHEPFARGETISADIRAAVLPRFLDPNKYVSGGSDVYIRFTGLMLTSGTSIGLSVPGEFYANYGLAGGIFGVFLYGLFVGCLVRFFTVRARSNPLWFAWSPVVLFSTLSAEGELGGILNQVTKSALVMAAVVMVVPAWRALRSSGGRRAERQPTGGFS